MSDTKLTEDDIRDEVAKIVDTEMQLAEFASDPKVQEFLQYQSKVNKTASTLWAVIESQMISAGIKSIKGPWGSVTVAERTNFKVDMDELPKKFIVKSADTKRIGLEYKLTGKPPKGVTTSVTTYLTKRLKSPEEIAKKDNIIEGEVA